MVNVPYNVIYNRMLLSIWASLGGIICFVYHYVYLKVLRIPVEVLRGSLGVSKVLRGSLGACYFYHPPHSHILCNLLYFIVIQMFTMIQHLFKF